MKHFKHLLLTSLLAMASAAGAWADTVDPVKPSGTGTEGDPYLIATPANLLWMSQYGHTEADGRPIRQAHYKLTDNIDLSTVCGNGVGHWQAMFTDSQPFAGVFDGDGHTISNLYSHETGKYLGLFKYLGECTIKDLTLADVDISSSTTGCAALAAMCTPTNDNGAYISNVRITGNVTCSSTRVAGFVGEHAHGTFINCVNEANITSTYYSYAYAAGIIGQSENGTLTLQSCVNKGTITSQEGYAAGIICVIGQQGNVSDCLNLGTVNASNTGGYNVGGIAGSVLANGANVTIDHCLNAAPVTGNEYCSYILGHARQGNVNVHNCVWDADATLTRHSSNSYDYCGHVSGSLVASNNIGLTTSEIAAGAAAFLLQDGRGETAWGQDLAASETHPTPSTSNRVYLSEGYIDCTGTQHGSGSYNNVAGSGEIRDHDFVSGYCTNCHNIESTPALVDGYYEIDNAGQLLWFARQSKASYNINGRLTADIDLSVITHPADAEHGIDAAEWEMIGSGAGYQGHFNGQGHTISNFYVKDLGDAGLFTIVNGGGIVRNLKVAGGVIDNTDFHYHQGIVVGQCANATIDNVHVLSGSITGANTASYIGGIVGDMGNNSTVIGCTVANVELSGMYTGGIVGRGVNGRIEGCANNSDITGVDRVGGIAGAAAGCLIKDCSNGGHITATNAANMGAAGIVADGSASTRLLHCLNTGDVTASTNTLALISNVGYSIAVTNCYSSAEATATVGTEPLAEPKLCKYTLDAPESGSVICQSLTSQQMSNGYAAFMLQAQRDDATYWGQQLGVDPSPILADSHRVYLNGHVSCSGEVKDGSYSNTPSTPVVDAHDWNADYICSACGEGQEPTLNGTTYEIANVGNLLWFQREATTKGRTDINGCLTADIDLSKVTDNEHPWNPIGTDSYKYRGSFDGQGHTVKGMTVKDGDHLGFFGYLNYATITNLNVSGSVSGNTQVGLLAGNAVSSNFTKCSVAGTVTGGYNVGGLIGDTYNSNLTDCVNYANVTGSTKYVGGIIGSAYFGNLDRCYNYATIANPSSNECNVGGIVGSIKQGLKLDHCANYGDVNAGGYNVGGLIGYDEGSSTNHHVHYCANYGNVSAARNIGGLCGWLAGEGWDHCFNAGNVVAGESNDKNGRAFGYNGSSTYYDNIYYADNCTYTNVRATELAKHTAFTQQQLESGEAAYTLGAPFGQSLGHDNLPRLSAPQVYYGRYQHGVPEAISAEAQYSNLILGDSPSAHDFVDGECTICGKHDGSVYQKVDNNLADWTSDNQGKDGTTSSHIYPLGAVADGYVLSFDWKVSSEFNYDKFFAVLFNTADDTEFLTLVNGASGDTQNHVDHTFTAVGDFYLKVSYIKDSSQASGSDTAWLTNGHLISKTALPGTWGDIDGDDDFDLSDVNAIRDMVSDPTLADPKADLNGDGRITIADITEAIRQLLMP